MTQQDWIRPDSYRASWLILIIGTHEVDSHESQITYWELATGNPDKIIDQEANSIAQASDTTEAELIDQLLNTLDEHRYNNSLILTPTNDNLRKLRRRLAQHRNGQPSLRGFNHVSVATILEEYFDDTLATYSLDREHRQHPIQSDRQQTQVEPSETPRRLWRLWSDIFRLVPPDSLGGNPL